MTIFSEGKFGTFKFGASTLTRPRFALRVDWNSDGIFDGSNELTAADAVNSFSVQRGRRYYISPNGDGFESEETGRFSLTLQDQSRRYDPYHALGPLYGMLAGGKMFDLRARTVGGQVFSVMSGLINEPVFTQGRDKQHSARLEGADGWAFLRDQQNLVTVALQENIFADSAMRLLLDQAGWPVDWKRDLNPGIDMRQFWWSDQRSPAAAIHELAHSELGRVYMAANGAITFRSALEVDVPALALTSDDLLGDPERLSPAEVIRNLVKVRSSRPVEYGTAVLWQMQDRLRVLPGESQGIWADYSYNNQGVAAKSMITPVATTDFTATVNQDGSGGDLTANFSVTLHPYSTRAYVVARNNGATTGFFLSRLRGNPIVISDASTFEARNMESQKLFGLRPFRLDIQQDVNTARQYADVLLAMLSPARSYLRVALMPNPEVQFGVDLGQQVSVSTDEISDVYRIIWIQHESENDLLSMTRTKWILEPVSRVLSGAQIPVQVPFQIGNI